MASRVATRVLLTIGFVAASLAYGSWIAERTVLDPGATRGATQALMATPAVRSMLADEIHDELVPTLGATAKDPQVKAAIDRAVADPRLSTAFADAVEAVHTNLVSDTRRSVTLDPAAVTSVVDTAFLGVAPKIAPKVQHAPPLRIGIGGADLPHLGHVVHAIKSGAVVASLLACAAIGAALLLGHDRRTLRIAGRRVAMLALPATAVFAIAPRMLPMFSHSNVSVVVGTVLEAYGHRVLPSAVLLAVGGLGVWLLAVLFPLLQSLASTRTATGSPSGVSAPARHAVPPLLAPMHAPRPEPAPAVPDRLYL